MKFNEDLAVIHAYLCADGYVIKNPPTQRHKYYKIGLRNTNIVLLKDFKNRFEKLWGVKPYLEKGQRCSKSSKELYEYLTRNFGSFYSYEWRMPTLNKGLTSAWLRTYFDCEGWVSIEKHKSRLIGADCVNSIGIKQVKAALLRYGIKSKLKYKKDRDIFRLYIYGKENLTKFSRYIGFHHPEKRMKLQAAIKDYVIYDWSFPKNKGWMIQFIKRLMREKAKVRLDNKTIRVISCREDNLKILKMELKKLFGIDPRVNEMVNGIGTRYYQLNINRKEDIKKAVENNLLNKFEMTKWRK
jgi:hypothetical protein